MTPRLAPRSFVENKFERTAVAGGWYRVLRLIAINPRCGMTRAKSNRGVEENLFQLVLDSLGHSWLFLDEPFRKFDLFENFGRWDGVES